ncbi:MAG: cache domain-containing protein [Candidatus Scalinduaceae bacterium]
MTKKITLALAIALLTFFLIVPFVSYRAYKSALKEEAFKHLITARDLLNLQIWNYFNERHGDIDTLSKNPVIAQGFTQLSGAFNAYGLGSPEFQGAINIYQPLMEYYVFAYGYVNIFFIDKDGNVIFSAIKEEFTGSNLLLTGKFKNSGIVQMFKRGLEDVTYEDYTWNNKINEHTAYFAAPIYDAEDLLGVLIIEIPFHHLDDMLTQRAGLGQTGEMYLVGEDGLMRSNSRFSVEPTMLKKKVDTEATREAFRGFVGTKITDDYRGVPVLSAYTPLNLNFIDWVLLVEIDEAEAFAPIHSVERKLTIIASIIGVIVAGYIYLTCKRYRRKNRHSVSE